MTRTKPIIQLKEVLDAIERLKVVPHVFEELPVEVITISALIGLEKLLRAVGRDPKAWGPFCDGGTYVEYDGDHYDMDIEVTPTGDYTYGIWDEQNGTSRLIETGEECDLDRIIAVVKEKLLR